MTLHEVEETLDTLIKRHSGLDESSLVTLLRAGGWEEKSIQEAIILYRSRGPRSDTLLPQVEEEHMLPELVDNDHLLPEGDAEVVETTVSNISEPESLQVDTQMSSREELPHNLPLRPFETSEHVWPFSRYKDVFYGEDDAVEENIPASTVSSVTPETAPTPTVIVEVPPEPQQPIVVENVYTREPVAPPSYTVQENIPSTYVPSRGDERLIMLASAMLLVILLLLGYLYGNGRL